MSDPSSGRADASALARLDRDMDRYIAHLSWRLRVISVALGAMAALLVVGHMREHAGAAVLISYRADDLLAGYPAAVVLALTAVTVWLRSRGYHAGRKGPR